ncbi:hypothetical protein LCM10_03075 [Rossellomorea aquimaris]|uniref:hypothetical protein n=1 Tax=Rossellomorea aquimaris TaxID=189382 RepID=UPI001CD47EE8|nr:hypothetical protein [Rossellomorea aquimaris]MCA1053957.1 hypothetical protein [Rossellomorea aquimaris]
MKKGIRFVLLFSIVLVTYYMTTHRPSEEQFYTWLDEEYKIDCTEGVSCIRKKDEDSAEILIETGSNIKKEYLLFNTVGKIFEDQNGDRTTIKAIGVLGKYFTIVEDGTSTNS